MDHFEEMANEMHDIVHPAPTDFEMPKKYVDATA